MWRFVSVTCVLTQPPPSVPVAQVAGVVQQLRRFACPRSITDIYAFSAQHQPCYGDGNDPLQKAHRRRAHRHTPSVDAHALPSCTRDREDREDLCRILRLALVILRQ